MSSISTVSGAGAGGGRVWLSVASRAASSSSRVEASRMADSSRASSSWAVTCKRWSEDDEKGG